MNLTSSAQWIQQFHEPAASGVRIIVFPHAGGSSSYYFNASRAISEFAETHVVQYPGRQERRSDPLVPSISGMAEAVAREIEGMPEKPLVLFGHSMGASVAFDVARKLEGKGYALAALFVSSRIAPSSNGLASYPKNDMEIIQEITRHGGTDRAILEDGDFLQMTLPVLRSDYKAIREYMPDPESAVCCPIYAMAGDNDLGIPGTAMLKWRKHTRAGFTLKCFSGGHFFVHEAVDDMAAYMKSVLFASGVHPRGVQPAQGSGSNISQTAEVDR